jgi:hypothetical protein
MDHRIVTLDEVKERVFQPNVVNYIGLMLRPGMYAWTVEVEYTMFKPDTEDNDDFHLGTMKWPEDWPLPWNVYLIASFHKRGQMFAEKILWRHGLKKVTPGYVPMALTGGKDKPQKFPLEGGNIFYLENHSKGAANVIYTNDEVKIRAAMEHEQKQAQVFFDEHKKWLETPEGKATFDAFWEKRPEGHVE